MAAIIRALLCLSLWLSVCQVRSLYIPQEMNRTLLNLRQYYKISNKDLYDGKHVVSREPYKGNMESKMLFMGGVLEMYEKLIGHMMKQLPTPSPGNTDVSKEDVRPKLSFILEKIQDLKKNRFQEQVNLLHGLQELRHIQMDSSKVQGKALWELPWVFEEASSLAHNNDKRRKRRQARKSHLGA